jgi:hypothetical protein
VDSFCTKGTPLGLRKKTLWGRASLMPTISSACAAVGGVAGNEAELSKTYPSAAISRKLFRYCPSISSASAEMSEFLPC